MVTSEKGSKSGYPKIPASALWTVSLGRSVNKPDVAVVPSEESSSEASVVGVKTLERFICFV